MALRKAKNKEKPRAVGNSRQKGKTMYMSYCRIEGTLNEMRAVIGEVEDHVYQEECSPVSGREISAFENLMHEIFDFLEDMELIDYEHEWLDRERLEEICNMMAKENGDEEWDDDDGSAKKS